MISKTRIPAVGYIRMSSDKQEASPHQQRNAIQTYAAEHGYRIIEWYIDEGISGSRSDRKAFQRLIADAKNGTFKAVLCWDQDRFSRFPPLEANHYWYLLDTADVHIATVAQGRLRFDDLGEWLKASVVQHGKAEYLKDLARNVKRGQREAASRGEWMGGPVPRGLVVVNRRLALGNPEDIALIRRIFNLFIDGLSPWAIAERLDADDVSTTNGGRWSVGTLNRILKNETYTGTYTRGEIAIPNNHPAIISSKTFATAQDRLTDCRCPSRSPKHSRGYLLTGLIHCGDCGCRMQGQQHNGCHTYICSAYWRNRGACSRNTVFENEVLGHIVGTIQEKLLDPRNVERLRKELYRQIKTFGGKSNANSLRKKLDTVEAKLGKAKRRLVEVDVDLLPIVQEHLRELQNQQDRLQADLATASTPRSRLLANCNRMVERALESITRLQDVFRGGDRETVRKCLREAVHRVNLWTTQEKRGRRHFYHLERGVIELFQQNATSERWV